MKTLIVGAGAAGLVCAFELEKHGERAVLVEAQGRVGGRCLTLRKGDRVEELSGAVQECGFAEGLYLNPGPARIPQHHVTVDYCRRLGVGLEPFLNRNYSGLVHAEHGSLAGTAVPLRDLEFDFRGRSFELLHAAITGGVAGGELPGELRQRLLSYLVSSGALDPNSGEYTGAERRTPGGAPLGLETLLESGQGWKLQFFEEFDMQATMLQIVGGTDRLTEAMAGRLKSEIRTGCPIERISVADDCVSVTVEGQEVTADRCVVTLPLPALAQVTSNLSSAFKDAVAAAVYEPAVKVGLETKSRWWEEDMRIYGGMTFTDKPSTQAWYPSAGFGADSGVLLGAYNFGDQGSAYSDLDPKARAAATIAEVEAVHGRSAEVRSSVSVAWRNQRWARGAYANSDYSTNAVLANPHPRLRLAGEHMGGKHGWIAGALESGAAAARWALGPKS